VTSGLLDTSVLIARVTIGELELGVLAAGGEETLARRADTFAPARGVHRSVRSTDALIAATAVVHGLPVVTQDDDVDRIAAAHPPLRVLRV
jgi:hypothetical protein